MKNLKILSIFCVAFLVCGFFAPPAQAILGDVNGDAVVNAADAVYLINYLFKNGSAPPNPMDADVDGSPAINLGDVLQLSKSLFGGCQLIPYTGVSIEVGSDIRFSSTVIPPDTIVGTPINIPVKIIENKGPDLKGMVIPLSYDNAANEVEVTLDSVSFNGSIIPSGWDTQVKIDNPNKRVLFSAYDQYGTAASIDSGETGTVARLYFTRLSLGPWTLVMSTTQVPPSHSFMLIGYPCADTLEGGISPSDRIFTPKVSLALKGDCNGDGIVNSADASYLINYLFAYGPPPTGL
jgi:hypothetical protein